MKLNKKSFFKASSLLAVSAMLSISLTSCASPLSFDSSVQLIVSDNSSTLADQSFSETSYEGIREFFKSTLNKDLPEASSKLIKENNGLWKKPGVDTISRIASYKYAFEDGAKIIVATGFNQQDGLQQITSDSPTYKIFKDSFKENAFIFIDGAMNAGTGKDAGSYGSFDSDPYNVSSVSYRADDGSFLTGISTAVFLNKYQEYFTKDKKDKKLSASAYVGLGFGSTLNFFNGFRLGIHYWNKILQPLIKTVDGKTPTLPVEWVGPTEKKGTNGTHNLSDFITGSFSANETKAITLTRGMRRNGANAIFPIAGPQTGLTVNDIKSNQSKDYAKSIVIGVDTAQEKTKSLEADLENGKGIGSGKIIQFSSVKNLKGSTAGVLNAIINGKNGKDVKDPINGYYGLGWNNVGTVTNAGVGVSDDGLKYLINPNWNQWNKTELNGITLDYLMENHTAKALVASDQVITQYNELLSGKFKTNTGSTGEKKVTNEEFNTKALENIKNTDGLNGPLNDGNWSIVNNSNGQNNFISIGLSNLIWAIKNEGKDVTYSVPSPNATYIAKTSWTKANTLFTDKSMFYRKN